MYDAPADDFHDTLPEIWRANHVWAHHMFSSPQMVVSYYECEGVESVAGVLAQLHEALPYLRERLADIVEGGAQVFGLPEDRLLREELRDERNGHGNA